MARRRAARSAIAAPLLILLAPFALIGFLFQKPPAPPIAPASPPVSYVSLQESFPARPSANAAIDAPSAPPAEAPARRLTEPDHPSTLYVSGHKVPMRDAANAKSQVLDRLGPGQAVTVLEQQTDWVRVRHGLTQREGWIQAKRLRDAPPVEEAEKPKAPSVGLTLSAAAIAKLLIAESIAQYPGPCACPYQSARNGSSCGRRAAYVRPGGYSPLCFAKDVTPEMVAGYRQNH